MRGCLAKGAVAFTQGFDRVRHILRFANELA